MPATLSSWDDFEPGQLTHRDVDDRAVWDFVDGDYTGIKPRRNGPSAPAAPLIGTAEYQPQDPPGYAIVQYDGASRVCRVIAPFADPVGAEEFAIAVKMVGYDVVPATRVARNKP